MKGDLEAFISVQLVLFNVISSTSIHVVTNESISHFTAEYYALCLHTRFLFVYSSTDGHMLIPFLGYC